MMKISIRSLNGEILTYFTGVKEKKEQKLETTPKPLKGYNQTAQEIKPVAKEDIKVLQLAPPEHLMGCEIPASMKLTREQIVATQSALITAYSQKHFQTKL